MRWVAQFFDLIWLLQIWLSECDVFKLQFIQQTKWIRCFITEKFCDLDFSLIIFWFTSYLNLWWFNNIRTTSQFLELKYYVWSSETNNEHNSHLKVSNKAKCYRNPWHFNETKWNVRNFPIYFMFTHGEFPPSSTIIIIIMFPFRMQNVAHIMCVNFCT